MTDIEETQRRTKEQGPPSEGAVWNEHHERWEEPARVRPWDFARILSAALVVARDRLAFVERPDSDWASDVFVAADMVAMRVAARMRTELDPDGWRHLGTTQDDLVEYLTSSVLHDARIAVLEELGPLGPEVDVDELERVLRPVVAEFVRLGTAT